MKNLLLLLTFLSTAFLSQAQDSWKIKLNQKVLLSAAAEDEAKNTKKIKRIELNKPGNLEVLYKEMPVKTGWQRSLLLFDEKDMELWRKDNSKAITKISNATLKKLFAGKNKIEIYTISLPTDPNKAAAVRVRRVHLCTLELK
ncbi:MAG TPA: hypothetical protein VF487_15540 [Chitinophagaceae bacterium]